MKRFERITILFFVLGACHIAWGMENKEEKSFSKEQNSTKTINPKDVLIGLLNAIIYPEKFFTQTGITAANGIELLHRQNNYRFLFSHQPELLLQATKELNLSCEPKTVVYLLENHVIRATAATNINFDPPLLKSSSLNRWLYFVQLKRMTDLSSSKLSPEYKIYDVMYYTLLSFGIEPESIEVIIEHLDVSATTDSINRVIRISDNFLKQKRVTLFPFIAAHEAYHLYDQISQKVLSVCEEMKLDVFHKGELRADSAAVEKLLESENYRAISSAFFTALIAILYDNGNKRLIESHATHKEEYDNILQCLTQLGYEIAFPSTPTKSWIELLMKKNGKPVCKISINVINEHAVTYRDYHEYKETTDACSTVISHDPVSSARICFGGCSQ